MPPKVVKDKDAMLQKAAKKDATTAKSVEPAKKAVSKKTNTATPKKTPKKRALSVESEDGNDTVKPTPKRVKIEHFKEVVPCLSTLANGVAVAHDGTLLSTPAKTGGDEHHLKLTGAGSFSIVGTLTFTDGDFKGYQAIIIKPPKTFNFMDSRFTPELRKRVYDHYFAHEGDMTASIPFEGKRKGNGETYAKAYSGGSKNRVALLTACKTIYEEATPVLYSKDFRIENCSTLITFLALLPVNLQESLRTLTIKHLKPAVGGANNKTAFQLLSAAKHITKIKIEDGVATTIATPAKAAEVFYSDIEPFLRAITAELKGKNASATKVDALEVFDIADEALMSGKDKQYNKTMISEFHQTLRNKAM